MISIFVHANNIHTMGNLRAVPALRRMLRPVLYQDAFRTLAVPAGPAIFTDMDLLDARQREVAASMALAIIKAAPEAAILNHPAEMRERYDLLRHLKQAGLSPVEAVRLESGDSPSTYPVFIRSECGANGPETGLLANEADFRAACSDLKAQGKPAKGRVAVGYHAEPGADGYFRKYGAFRIGKRIIPQHIQFNRDWIVKANAPGRSELQIGEELDYCRENPHADLLMPVFEAGAIGFGRADYGFAGGKFCLYEINTNPTFPRFVGGDPRRNDRRAAILDAILAALSEIDDGSRRQRSIPFMPLSPYRDYVDTHNWSPWARAAWRIRLVSRKRTARNRN